VPITLENIKALCLTSIQWWALCHGVVEVIVFGLAALGVGTTGLARDFIEGYATVFMYPLFLIGLPPLINFGLLISFPGLVWVTLRRLSEQALPSVLQKNQSRK